MKPTYYGKRILHYLSPVRFNGNVFNHESDSNFKVTMKTVDWLPECHHYILVPQNHRIVEYRSNVTLRTHNYPRNAISNRSQFDAESFWKAINFKYMDIDIVFTHQPELLYNICMALSDRRYGEIVKKLAFFHWVDCSASRGSPAIPHGYMRQLETINLADKVFFHSPVSVDYLATNFRIPRSTTLNREYINGKSAWMPLSSTPSTELQEFSIAQNKPIIVFNHRWSQSTGINRFLEYTESVKDKYLFVITDSTAEKVPEGYYVVPKPLNNKEYRWLLSIAHATVCFVDGYATWNLAVQDAFHAEKPALVYHHLVMDNIIGPHYPFYFNTKSEFETHLSAVPSVFKWPIIDHDKTFRENVICAMRDFSIFNSENMPKDAPAWVWYILNGFKFKADIANQVQPNIQLNGVWQYIRRWLLHNGIEDDPNCVYPAYTIDESKRAKLEELVKNLDLTIKGKTNKPTVINKKHKFF